jgi:hypothetical protein
MCVWVWYKTALHFHSRPMHIAPVADMQPWFLLGECLECADNSTPGDQTVFADIANMRWVFLQAECDYILQPLCQEHCGT